MPITTKLGRMVTNLDVLLPIMFIDPLVTWELKDHVTSYNHSISNNPMPMKTKLSRGMTYHEGVPLVMTLGSHNLSRSPDKLKALYLHCQSVYSHQNWQNGNLV